MASIGSPLSSLTNPSSAASAAANTSSSASSSSSTAALGNESTFLQLLVTEIQNQDPTAPMDSTTFLTQLAQFSQLEQTTGIRQDIETGTYDAPTGTASASTPASTASTATPASATTGAALANLTAASTPASLANTAAQDLSNTALTTTASTSGN
jgi:flagellar basal-body rod modification protein FlgD